MNKSLDKVISGPGDEGTENAKTGVCKEETYKMD